MGDAVGDVVGIAVGDRIDIFNPTPPQAQLLLDLLQRADCSLEDIAEALRTSVAALTVYLASDDAIEILAQAELANARRGRLAATAQLDKCAHALSLILDRYISDTTIAVRRDTPKTRREDLIHQESARRAAAQLFKVANFTPRIVTSQLTTNPTRKRGATPAPTTTASNPTPPAPLALLLAPRQRDEAPESRLQGLRQAQAQAASDLDSASRATAAPDRHAPNAPCFVSGSERTDEGSRLATSSVREDLSEAHPVPNHSSTSAPTFLAARITPPRSTTTPRTPAAPSQETTQPASPAPAATVPP
ncbi:MAG: hypothetical protein K2Y21_06245 [Phycisphaerales bacterium]|nr:hypothetical protein [Phycisphaerales bacterium]